MLKKSCLLFSLVLTMPLAQAQPLPAGVEKIQSIEGITEYRLRNGLQLLLAQDDAKPTTTVNMTYRVGSRHENYGETGMAHLLEHLLFKGSKKNPQVWSEFTRRGLAANGSTWFDRTNYFASFASNDEHLRWYLSWQADAMVNSFIAKRDLDTEMTVVRNEMEMGENNPSRILFEKTLATMYQWHHYGQSTIGARSDVENVNIERLQAFYKTYYQPDNATLIVSGKFNPTQVLQWVVSEFGRIKKPNRVLAAQYTLDPAQDGERSTTLRRQGGSPLVSAAYHVPPAANPDYVAVELIGLIMADEPSGRLHKALVDTRLAASIFSISQGLFDPGFAMFGAQLAPEQNPDPAKAALLSALEDTVKHPITEEELARAKVKWLNDWELAFTNPQTVGVALSESVAQGDWRLFFLLRDRVRQVGLAHIQQVLAQRFLASNRTLGLYLPTEQPVRAPAPSKVKLQDELRSFVPQKGEASVAAFDASPANIDRLTQRSQLGGLQVALLPKPSKGHTVNATLTLHFGDEKTLFGQNEVPDFVATLLDKGSASLSRQQVQDRLDALQTQLNFKSITGGVAVQIVSRQAHLIEAIDLVADLLKNPSLSPNDLDEIKNKALASLQEQRKEPEAVAQNALERQGNPYPPGDVRYVSSFDEQAQNLRAVTNAQVRQFHQRFYSARHSQFAAVGDFDVAAVQAALKNHFADWQSAQPYQRIPEPLIAQKAQRLVLATPDKQNAIWLARLDLPLQDTDPDYPALMMANHLLGAGGNSRLWKRVREKEGLSYDVRSSIHWNNEEPHSTWLASAIFAPKNLAKVEQAFRQELALALKQGFTPAELKQGQQGLLAFRKLSRAQDANLAAVLGSNLHLKRSMDVSARVDAALEKLTLDQVNTALRQYIQPDALITVMAGDF